MTLDILLGLVAFIGVMAGIMLKRVAEWRYYGRVVIGCSLVVIMIAAIVGTSSKQDSATPSTQASGDGFLPGMTSSSSPDAQCRADLQCWGDRHSARATLRCKPAIERLARYKHEWTDGMLESKLMRFRWTDERRGHIAYIGDRINFQNGFGAWVPHIYTCVYNPGNDTVVEAAVEPGRL